MSQFRETGNSCSADWCVYIYIYIYVQCARGLENAILIEEYIFQTDNFSAFFRVYDVYRG